MLPSNNIHISKKSNSGVNPSKKEQQNFADILNKEIIKFEKSIPTNKTKEFLKITKAISENKKEIIQEKVINWLSKLSLEDRRKVSTISEYWIKEVIIQMYLLYKTNNNIIFKPVDENNNFFKKNNQENKKSEYDEFMSFLNFIISPNNEIANKTNNLNDNKKFKNNSFFYYNKYFIKIQNKNEKENNINIDINKREIKLKFLDHIRASLDNDFLIMSDELLSDMKLFKEFFKYFTDDNYFTFTK